MIAATTTHTSFSDWLVRAIESGNPSAFWRLPRSQKIYGVVQITNDEPLVIDQIENSPTGFVINPFEKKQAPNFQLIKGDFSLEYNPLNSEIQYFGEYTAEEAYEILSTKQPRDISTGGELSFISEATDFSKLVEKAIKEIKCNSFSKVVLARKESFKLTERPDLNALFTDTCKLYPNAFVSMHYTKNYGLWLGATPETLLTVSAEKELTTMSLAGTQPILPSQNLSEIAWTQKEIEEQAMVSRYIIDCFKKIRLREFTEIGPQTIRAGRLAHLQTLYTINLHEVRYPNLASTLLELLHPTSAVCGMPLESALTFIHYNENMARELYSGFLGPVNFSGNTQIFVNLRCVKITSDYVHYYAGAGITLHSNPEKEKVETELKMRTMKRVFEKS